MKITCITATYNRPELLGRMIRCFELQTHEDRTLLILDDTGQYGHRKGDRWELLSVPRKIHKYAYKLNVLAAMLPPDVEGIAIMDDDDVYLPHHLAACSAALERSKWAQPRVVYEHRLGGLLRVNTALADGMGYLYHGAWCYRKNAFDNIGGYHHFGRPACSVPHFDVGFRSRMTKRYGPSADTTIDCKPHYIFCRDTTTNIMGENYWPLGEVGYRRRRNEIIAPFPGPLNISWQLDYTALPVIGEDTNPRPQ